MSTTEQKYQGAIANYLDKVKSELDPWTTRKNEISFPDPLTGVMLTPAHVQFARYGRAGKNTKPSNKFPPLEPISKWTAKNNIAQKWGLNSNNAAAWAVLMKIGLYGTNNYVPNAPDFLEETLEKYLPEYLDTVGVVTVESTSEFVEDMEFLPELFKDFKI